MQGRTPTTIAEWRISWQPQDIQWRSRADQWRERQQQERELRRRARVRRDRRYFGEQLWGASAQQRYASTNLESLRQHDLPEFRSEWELAEWLGLPLHRLRWFTHDKAADTVWHYVQYTIPKRSGGTRTILAPKRELKALQRKLLHELIEKIPPSHLAHGFIKARSTVTNADQHTGRAFVLRLDLRDFFPSITYRRVRGLFIRLGYSFSVASVLALLCTEYQRERYERNGIPYYVSIGERHLVQGAPTSPALSNLIARGMDYRLNGLASKRDFSYTRYADDLTFSGDSLDDTLKILDVAQRIIPSEGFAVNKAKTKIFRQSSRQMVTGIVVNQQTSTPRQLRRKVRAILHNAQQTGLHAQNKEGHENFRAYLLGLIGYIHAANPQHGAQLLAALQALPDE